MSQKYVIVHFIDLENVPKEFVPKDWPLHITFLANFALSDISLFQSDLKQLAESILPFNAVAENEAYFGPKQNVHVNLIRPEAPLLALHNNLLSRAQKHGAQFDELQFAGTGFRPHTTKQRDAEIADGQNIFIEHFTLVDMYPENDIHKRKAIETYRFA